MPLQSNYKHQIIATFNHCRLPLAAQPLLFVVADLVVDTYLADVVESLKEQGLTDEVDEIEIDVDGTWKPVREDQKVRCLIHTSKRL